MGVCDLLIVSDFPPLFEELRAKRWALHNKGSIVSGFLEGDKCHESWIDF
jgi:hypothetical protein